MNMDWNKYQAEALTTAIYPLERELDYTILGLCSEVAEVADIAVPNLTGLSDPEWKTEMKSEVGDCFWYAAAIADAMKVPLQEVWEVRPYDHEGYSHDSITVDLVVQAGLMAGLLKKAIRDDAGVLTKERKAIMLRTLGTVLAELNALCVSIDSSAHAVTQANLNKLSDRKQRGVLGGSGNVR